MASVDVIAIVGVSFELPGDTRDEERFWQILEEKRNMMTEWPASRMDTDTFYHAGSQEENKLYSRGAHFLDTDPAMFDAPFFAITTKEAMAMDPQQRHLLEVSYQAFENAGIPSKALRGTRTAVFGASMTDDYSRMQAKDPDRIPQMTATGTAYSIQPNRISWYFDLRGPSVHIDTACSSSLVALDLACQSLRTGTSSMALVAGINLILGPDTSLLLSNQKFLSPDSVSHSFDSRANGYGRGEGCIALVLKPVESAIRDGDTIRAVIRATGTNQDGRTQGLTQPSAESQEALIREVYAKAGLDVGLTRYVEAHGTGTALGDPIEADALRNVFGEFRTPEEPLFFGSVKSNIGHLEGCSGLAGVVKSILVLERGVIPATAGIEKLNPAVCRDSDTIQVSLENIPWPSQGPRRVSVNSFGFGGTNAHVVIDDAYHFLQSRALPDHSWAFRPTGALPSSSVLEQGEPEHRSSVCPEDCRPERSELHLAVCTAPDEKALQRVIQALQQYRSGLNLQGEEGKAEFQMPHRSHVSNNTHLSFVFTGQGVQYASMGLGLMGYKVFRDALEQTQAVFSALGCTWSVHEVLRGCQDINLPEYSQPLCTALQIALVHLLARFGLCPQEVIGHSSGEIAAAYAAGALSLASACKVAYYRGQLAARLKSTLKEAGGMMSVNLPGGEIRSTLDRLLPGSSEDIHVACYNSPSNCTLSGPEGLMRELESKLSEGNIFARRLATGVAYHSPAMEHIVADYLSLMGTLSPPAEDSGRVCRMISTVTGGFVQPEALLDPHYWTQNLVSPVRFTDAIRVLAESRMSSDTTVDLVEVGPHATLRRPILDTVAGSKGLRYSHALDRTKPSAQPTLELAGRMFCYGHPVVLPAVNRESAHTSALLPLADLPAYPFDHSQKYWDEPRFSRDHRLHRGTSIGLLGHRSMDWNPLEPRWRNFLCVERFPWTGEHIVSNMAVLPATAMLVMAFLAVKETVSGQGDITGFYIQEATFSSPLVVGQSVADATETMVRASPIRRPYEKEVSWFHVKIHAYIRQEWRECCQATVQAQVQRASRAEDQNFDTEASARSLSVKMLNRLAPSCSIAIGHEDFYRYWSTNGIHYGENFRLLRDIKWDGTRSVNAQLVLPPPESAPEFERLNLGIIHPISLDGILQTLLTPISGGLSVAGGTFVPSQLAKTWISASAGCLQSATPGICVTAETKHGALRNQMKGAVRVTSAEGAVLAHFEDITMTAIVHADLADAGDRRLLHNIEWKPQYGMLSPGQLRQILSAIPHDDVGTPERESFRREVNALVRKVVLATHSTLSTKEIQGTVPPSLQRYIQWMQYEVEHGEQALGGDRTGVVLEDVLQHLGTLIDETWPQWKLVHTVAENLESILAGDVDPTRLIFEAEIVKPFYDDTFHPLDSPPLRHLLALISHENPCLRILEVGAGTGSWTSAIMDAFHELEKMTGGHRFSKYKYTDLSPAFFNKAKEMIPPSLLSRFEFQVLDIEQEPSQQGFDLHDYDLVIAGSVLHATRDLGVTMQNIHQLLKPGGTVLAVELTQPRDVVMHMVFGLLHGWWAFRDQWREQVPLLDETGWDEVLKATGFSGAELVLRDFPSPICHTASIIVSRAQLSDTRTPVPVQRVLLAYDAECEEQAHAASGFAAIVRKQSTYDVERLPLEHEETLPLGQTDVVVSFLEWKSHPFKALSPTTYTSMKQLLQRSRNLLWVSSADQTDPAYASHHVMKGVFRNVRVEAPDKRAVHLEVRGSPDSTARNEASIFEVFRHAFEERRPDLEYLVDEGIISTARLVEEIALNDAMNELSSPKLRTESWSSERRLKLALGSPGVLETLQFVEDDPTVADLPPGHVEVRITYWGINFKDIMIALGRLDDELGCECAGIITRVSSNCHGFNVGDGVCFIGQNLFRSYVQISTSGITKIPDSMAPLTAVAAICPGVTAYHCLVTVARLSKHDKILVHSGAGATGQMAIRVAQMVGAEVFATVGDAEKRRLLVQDFGLEEDHILYSRNTAFAPGIKAATKGYGVDVVLNSLSGDGLRASWDCIAPYGRFIEIGKTDIMANSSLPMANFQKNVSYCAVDIHHLMQSNRRLTTSIQDKVIALVASGQLLPPAPVHQFPVGDVEQAFRYFQSGRNTGRTIVTPVEGDPVQTFTEKRSEWTFASDGTYLIAGGLGGLGRAIVSWMLQKGVRHLILPSRSGASSQAARQLVEMLELRGVHVSAPKCNVSSSEALSDMLRSHAHSFPRIRGCINASLVLQDGLFENMSYEQWEQTIRSKAYTSWNLHEQLPTLDFFIQLSSIAGIVGFTAQANYAAGCTFQDALSRHRIATGQKAVSLDVGWMTDVGIIAENKAYRQHRELMDDMQRVRSNDLLALLEIYCDPSLPLLPLEKHQLVVGIKTPAQRLAQGLSPILATEQPLFLGFSQLHDGAAALPEKSEENPAASFKNAPDKEGRVSVVVSALISWLARALSMSVDDIESSRPLSDYGVDSLMAVELRNWMSKDFKADLAVFEIMNGTSIAKVGEVVTEKTMYGQVEVTSESPNDS
ncbi:hypothetical protein F5Y17DRAFT_460850 [Xylariaceae sp. FL0594]|nr:hypothetical protein F5Y17DRAFT_460850 [Xylariaceae sp. FL0594]